MSADCCPKLYADVEHTHLQISDVYRDYLANNVYPDNPDEARRDFLYPPGATQATNYDVFGGYDCNGITLGARALCRHEILLAPPNGKCVLLGPGRYRNINDITYISYSQSLRTSKMIQFITMAVNMPGTYQKVNEQFKEWYGDIASESYGVLCVLAL